MAKKPADLGLDVIASNPGTKAMYQRLAQTYGLKVAKNYLAVMAKPLSLRSQRAIERSVGNEKRAREDRPNG